MDDVLLPPPSKRCHMEATPLKYDSNKASSKEEQEMYKMFVNAAYQGDLETIKRMLKTNVVPINCHDICEEEPLPAGMKNGTALHAVCEALLNIAVVQELLKAGAQVNLKDKNGEMPLVLLWHHYCNVSPQQVEITHLLLAAGSNMNTKGNDGCMPLMYVGCNGDINKMFLEL